MFNYIVVYGIIPLFLIVEGEQFNRNNLVLHNNICNWSDMVKNTQDEECTIICHRGDTISVQQAIQKIINMVN